MAFDDEFERFYKRHHPALFYFAKYHTNSAEDSLEIVNDVFVSVWQKKEHLVLNDSLKSYLFTSVKNACINWKKKNKLQFTELTDVEQEADMLTDDAITLKEQTNDLNKVLESLPPKCRQVFLMSRVDKLKYQEIADALDISIKTVEAQMSKALKIFKKYFKDA